MTTETMVQRGAEALDQHKAEAFAGRMLEVLNGAGAALMISIGHRVGLFDAMAGLPPATSERVAMEAGLNERYVREWLGAMVTARVVEHDPQTGRYWLPKEHAACLTRAAAPGNVASPMQWIAVLGAVESDIVECFRKGGGLPYDRYPRFHEVMAEESAQTTLSALVESIVPLVEGLPARLERGVDVLDVGCGIGRAMVKLAAAYPRSRFAGYDMCPDAVAVGQREARAAGLSNVRLEARDVSKIGQERGRYALITAFDAIHDQADPAGVLRAVREALADDGVFLMQDIAGSSHVHNNIGAPLGTFTYTISCMHCMCVSLGQGGAGLGAAWGEEKALEMLREAGFADVTVARLPHDIVNTYYIARKGAQ